jgi:hypothetical protein
MEMTVQLSRVFDPLIVNPNYINASLISIMNRSTILQAMFDILDRNNVPIKLGVEGEGKFFRRSDDPKNARSSLNGEVIIDPKDFAAFANSLKLLVIRITHEIGHVLDSLKITTPLPGSDGLRPAPSSLVGTVMN